MAFSDKESSSFSFTGSTGLIAESEKVVGENLYKTDKKCFRCEVKFGWSFTIYKKKYWCKFCRRGVCSECSPQRVPHPVSLQISRICNTCYQFVMADHFTREVDEEILNLKKQRDDFNFLLGQEIRTRAKISTKKRILEGILSELEKESERKDRELRIKISKLKAKKEYIVGKMNSTVKKFHESQREREKKEKKIKELEAEGLDIKSNFCGPSELWGQMRELREKKMKLLKKCDLALNSSKCLENENYDDLLVVYAEMSEENKFLLEELSQLTAELEIKEHKIKNLQKKIAEMAAITSNETESETEAKEIKAKITQQNDIIQKLRNELIHEEKTKDELENKPCQMCLAF